VILIILTKAYGASSDAPPADKFAITPLIYALITKTY
jgi:hypothetical protein